MPVFDTFIRKVYVAIATLTWSSLAAATALHAVLSYILLALSGEVDLTSDIVTFAYYYMTTATTVGYGDLSPTTAPGRVWAILIVLPGSIAIFTACLGKAVTDLGTTWRARMNGFGDYSEREGHTIILGWQPIRTKRLISLLMADRPDGERIVLVAKALEQNPMPEQFDYVRADGLSTPAGLQRAGIAGAGRVIVRGADDDETLAATLAASSTGTKAHIVAYFEDERAAELISKQCPDVEAIGSLSAEILVRASRDPGASRVADRLLSAESDDTAFSMTLPTHMREMTYFDAFTGLKRHYDMTLVGTSDSSGHSVDLNCSPDQVLRRGQTIFYIADKRVPADGVRWDRLGEHTLEPPTPAAEPAESEGKSE